MKVKNFEEAFIGNRQMLCNKLDIEHGLLTTLRDRKVLTKTQIEGIINRPKTNQVEALLDVLEKRPDHEFEIFCECLATMNQQHIVDTLWADGTVGKEQGKEPRELEKNRTEEVDVSEDNVLDAVVTKEPAEQMKRRRVDTEVNERNRRSQLEQKAHIDEVDDHVLAGSDQPTEATHESLQHPDYCDANVEDGITTVAAPVDGAMTCSATDVTTFSKQNSTVYAINRPLRELGRFRSDNLDSAIDGIAHLRGKIYVVSGGSNDVQVFCDSSPFSRLPSMCIGTPCNPSDIVACTEMKRLYVADFCNGCILAIGKLETANIRIKPVEFDTAVGAIHPISLSVRDGRLLVTDGENRKLLLYDAKLHRRHVIDVFYEVSSKASTRHIGCLFHAVETSCNTAIVSHKGSSLSDRVVEIDLNIDDKDSCGKVLRFFPAGSKPETSLNWPARVVLIGDKDCWLLVVDRQNHRVLIISASLELKGVLLMADSDPKEATTGGPRFVIMGPKCGQLIISRTHDVAVFGADH
jgi:hypothetical protein